MKKNVVVIGGGIGGTLIANLLAKKLGPHEAEITVVSATPRHVYQPGWLYVPFGREDVTKLERPLDKLLRRDVRLRIDRVLKLDSQAQEIVLASGKVLRYDYLVLSTGSLGYPEVIPGLAEAGDHFYTEEAALQLRTKLADFQGGNILIGVGGLPYKCPVAPVEFTFLLDEYLRKRGIRDRTHIRYTFPISACFTIPTVAPMAEKRMLSLGIEIETFFNLESMDPVAKVANSLEGASFPFDIAVFVPPHKGAEFLRGHSIADKDGWVTVDRETLQVKGTTNIWALGDTVNLPISKAGSTAHFQAPTIAAHLTAAVRSERVTGPHAVYDGHVMCFLEAGDDQATVLDFNYAGPPHPKEPSALGHLQKMAFNRAYWYLVPSGRI